MNLYIHQSAHANNTTIRVSCKHQHWECETKPERQNNTSRTHIAYAWQQGNTKRKNPKLHKNARNHHITPKQYPSIFHQYHALRNKCKQNIKNINSKHTKRKVNFPYLVSNLQPMFLYFCSLLFNSPCFSRFSNSPFPNPSIWN